MDGFMEFVGFAACFFTFSGSVFGVAWLIWTTLDNEKSIKALALRLYDLEERLNPYDAGQ